MGNNPSVSAKTDVTGTVTIKPFLHHAWLTFRPSTTTFNDAFIASAQQWVFRSPATNEGLVAEILPNNWQSRLKSLGATPSEPLWMAVDAHFGQLLVADGNGIRGRLEEPDVVYVGRRTSAVISRQTITFSNNTAGRVRIRVNPARFIFAASTPAGALADITVIADGVLTVTQLAADAVTQLMAITGFAALYTATSALGVVTVVSNVVGYPLIIEVMPSTPGPTMVQTVTTANVADAYRGDLDEMQEAFETGSALDPPQRRAYHITDLQGDDVVDMEGFQWVEDQANTSLHNPPRPYLFHAWSTTGDKVLLFNAERIGNFDSQAVSSLAQQAVEANAGAGFTRADVFNHDRFEFAVPALLGRVIGYLPGVASFTDKVLYGSTPNARISPRDYGDNENLSDDRRFNWYGAEGPRGSARYGYSPNAEVGFFDRKWLEDYCTFICTERLVGWKQLNNITTYTTATIQAGAGIIKLALATIPAIDPNSIRVSFLGRDQVDPNDIALRIYKDYSAFSVSFGVINKIGTLADPFGIIVNDGG